MRPCDPETERQILDWFATGETGLSSRNLARAALGYGLDDRAWEPADPDDLRRCVLLIEAAPAARQAVDVLALDDVRWRALAGVWDEITESLYAEIGRDLKSPRRWRAPKTYQVMRAALDAAETPA